ncbi:hypothetical protein E2F46_06190 [Luteimonas aestuarii]|uniref:Uncharacterized protein n=1 Tax=Luteimonas aestuarii TaxID=453837 RepID=A0A4R5TY78_9GAMM|nr:hypothetical protein [Luteimonas aestuarii]TDK26184.1 hypothetical protein E2F46_06190 [Luteimonas aestuarii]
MGARVKTISDEMLVAGGVHELDPELLITTAQAAMLLGCAVSGMAERKRSGRPPLPRQPGGRGTKVSYLLGEVLAARRSAAAPSNVAAKKAQQDHVRGFSTFTSFLAEGYLLDQWPFVIARGRPVDFIGSLAMGLSDENSCLWLTLGQYLDELKLSAASDEAASLNFRLERETDEALGPSRAPARI